MPGMRIPSPGSWTLTRARLPGGGERPGEVDRLVAGGDLAREARLLQALDERPEPRPGVDAQLARELVAPYERALGEHVLAAQRLAEHLGGEVEVALDRDVGLAPARREPVGHAEDRDVDLDRRGLAQVRVDGAVRERALV